MAVRGDGGDRHSCGCHRFLGGEFAAKVKAFYCVLGFCGGFLRKIGFFVIKVNIWDLKRHPETGFFRKIP